VISFPQLVSGNISESKKLDESEVMQQLTLPDTAPTADPLQPDPSGADAGSNAAEEQKNIDDLFKK
jgi:hypothetical protein